MDLREYMLGRLKPGFAVLDCCQGDMVIWRRLRQRFECRYTGLDVKPAPHRLVIDSVRIVETSAAWYDVIDVDTYGSPWKHYAHICAKNPKKPQVVFLAVGIVKVMGVNFDHLASESLGIKWWMPSVLGTWICHEQEQAIIHAMANQHGRKIKELYAAEPGKHARYYGVVLK